MPNIPKINIGGVTYDVKDTVARDHLVEVSDTQPTSDYNRVWVKPAEGEYTVPTMDDHNDLKSAFDATSDLIQKSKEEYPDDSFNVEITGFVQGYRHGNTGATVVTDANYITTSSPIYFLKDDILKVYDHVSAYPQGCYIVNLDGTIFSAANTHDVTISENDAFYLEFRNTSGITPSDLNSITIKRESAFKPINDAIERIESNEETITETVNLLVEKTPFLKEIDFTNGYFSSGKIVPYMTTRIVTKKPIFCEKSVSLWAKSTLQVDVETLQSDGTWTTTGWIAASLTPVVIAAGSIAVIQFKYTAYTNEIDPSIVTNENIMFTTSETTYDLQISDHTINNGDIVLKWEIGGFNSTTGEKTVDNSRARVTANLISGDSIYIPTDYSIYWLRMENGSIVERGLYMPDSGDLFVGDYWFHAPKTSEYRIMVRRRDTSDMTSYMGTIASTFTLKKANPYNTRTNKFNGKNIICFGDSITYGAKLIDKTTNTWPKLFASFCDANTINAGVSGAHFGRYPGVDPDESILTEIENADFTNTDYAIIMAGTNDFAGNCPVGDVTDNVETTVSGACNLAISKILTAKKSVKILICSPFFRSRIDAGDGKNSDDNPNTLGKYLNEYVEAIGAVAKQNHVPFLNMLDNSMINKLNSDIYLADGLHPNETGQMLIAQKIFAWMNSVY